MANSIRVDTGPDNRVTQVSVMASQALVTRTVRTGVTAGFTRIDLITDARRIDPNSLQVSVQGKGEILGVQLRRIPLETFPQTDLDAIDRERKQLEVEKRALEIDQGSLVKRRRFFDSVGKFADVQVPTEIQTRLPEVDKLEALYRFLVQNYQTLSEQELAIAAKLDQVNERLTLVNRKLKQGHPGRTRRQELIELSFQSAAKQTLEIRVDYLLDQAGWEPVYKVNVREDLSGLTLAMFARVHQHTGEDWDQVELQVSNAVPLRGAALPEIRAWFIQPEPPPTDGGPPPMMMGAAAAEPAAAAIEAAAVLEEFDLDDLDAPGSGPAAYAEAETQASSLSVEYRLPMKVDIPNGSDDSLHPLFTKEPDGEFFYYTIPCVDSRAYLVCNARNDRELLPGQLNLYLGGRFLGSTRLMEKRTGEGFWINLGIDRDIKTRYTQTVDRTAETVFGMVERSNVARELAFVTEIENNKADDVLVVVDGRAPVSKSDKFQISALQTDPPPSEKDIQHKPGVNRWQLTVPAGSSRTIELRFSIKYPRGAVLAGI